MNSSDQSNKEIEEEIKKQLAPLFADFIKGTPKFEMFDNYLSKYVVRKIRSADLSQLWRELMVSLGKMTKRTRSFLLANYYLSFVETYVAMEIDWAVLLLIAGGHALHLEPDYSHRFIRHAQSFEDLRSANLSLAVKLDFLEFNGISFFSRCVDCSLRNKIAHLNYEIDKRGQFYTLTKGKRTQVDVEKRLLTSFRYTEGFRKCFDVQVKKLLSS